MRKRKTITIIIIAAIIVLSLITGILSLQGCSCREIKYDNENHVFWIRGNPYIPDSRFVAIQTKSIPIGRLDGFGYILYPVANDPNMLFIYPQDVLTLKRTLLARADVDLPDPAKDSVSWIEINGNRIDDVSKETFLAFFRDGSKEKYQGYRYNYNQLYSVNIYLSDYPQVYYQTYIAQFEDVYCLLIDDEYYIMNDNLISVCQD